MSFIKQINNKLAYSNNDGVICSFNHYCDKATITPDTKVVIVGTITSFDGRQRGFYYCGVNNKMYQILDRYFLQVHHQNTDFVKLKKNIISCQDKKTKEKYINQLILLLKSKQIAFLDVVDMAINQHGTSNDDDLKNIKLDYDSFSKENLASVKCLLANSKNALYALNMIIAKNGLDIKTKLAYQDRFHYDQNQWNKILKEYGI